MSSASGGRSSAEPPPDRVQPAPPDRAAPAADQPPVARELPGGVPVGPDDPRLGGDPAAAVLRANGEVHRGLRVARLREPREVVHGDRSVPEGAPEAADRTEGDLLARPPAELDEADPCHLVEERCARIE